jgi:hypothetical protein
MDRPEKESMYRTVAHANPHWVERYQQHFSHRVPSCDDHLPNLITNVETTLPLLLTGR